ncbi:MAG: cytochrome-c peroxidase [Lentimicrobiaceae bacterium]|nr:cytochrome-c peroxidase [Lentimicrobiaceae bacterium]
MQKTLFLTAILFSFIACTNTNKSKQEATTMRVDSIMASAKNVFQPLPGEALNPENPLTPEKIALGKALYYDNILSMNQTQSCNTCHNLETYGVDNKPTSPGDGGAPGVRNSPTVLNSALHFLQFWDGRMKDVEEQAGGPVMNPDEMNMPSEAVVMARLEADENYPKMFAAAFPEEKNAMTFDAMRKAIGAFERTLLTPSRFDDFLKGDHTALTEQELTGLKTFMDVGCTACHNGPLLGGNMFQKYPLFGTHEEYTGSKADDLGRMQETKNEADKYVFKVPSLRNIAETWPYLHDGSVRELDNTVDLMAKAELNKELTPGQTNDIVAFMKALTGEVPAAAKR